MKTHSILLAAAICAAACQAPVPQDFHVIPMPESVTVSEGSFKAAGAAVKIDENIPDDALKAIVRFTSALEKASGKKMHEGEGGFSFVLNRDLGAEEYAVNISGDGAVVEASALNGFVYATETLKQMLPAGIFSGKKASGPWVLPYVSIFDSPRFDYRGMHMDPCRHFWTVEETKK